MEYSALIAGLSVVVTLLTSLFKTANLTVKQKNLLATGLSVVAGAVYAWNNGDVNVTSLSASAVAVYGGAQLAYNFILKGTGFDAKLEASLFGSNAKVVEEVLKDVAVVEKAVKARKPAPKKPAAKKTSVPTANKKRTTK